MNDQQEIQFSFDMPSIEELEDFRGNLPAQKDQWLGKLLKKETNKSLLQRYRSPL